MVASRATWFRPAERPFAAAAAGLAVILFGLSWGLLHHGFYTRRQIVDTPIYESYGDRMADGEVPYRDFRPEYPPLALPVFALPSVVVGAGADSARYRYGFEWVMALCGGVGLLAAAMTLSTLGASPRRLVSAAAFIAIAPLLLGSMVLTRFDLWPATLTVLALAALVAGRDRLGAAGLGLATAAKLYPGVLAPIAVAWAWRRRGRAEGIRSAAIFVAAAAVPYLLFALVAPAGVWESLSRQLSRPLQIESLGSAAMLALKELGVLDVRMESSHGSQNVAGAAGDAVGIAMTVLQAAVLVSLWIAYARGPQRAERLVRYSAAAVLAFVAFGKVLSPQFMIWLLPLVPLVAGRRGLAASGLLAIALALTQVWFPFQYWDWAEDLEGGVTWLVLARDLVLVAMLAVLVWPSGDRDAQRLTADGAT